MTELTGQFEAMGSDNQRYTVLIFTEYISVATHTDPHAVVEGLKELRTSDGFHVNRLGKGEYKILQTDVSLRSESSEAP